MADRRVSIWQKIALLAISAIGTLVLLAFADTRDQLKNKADRREISSLEDRMKSMDDKLDFIIQMHIDENGNIVRMRGVPR